MTQQNAPIVDLQRANEIVVEREYAELVADELTHFGVHLDRADHNRRLGLSRLMLTGSAVSTDEAVADPGVTDVALPYWKQALASIDVGDGPAPTNLDVCLAALRSRFAHCYGGFYPTMGKNRDFTDVEGLPFMSGGGASRVPVPVRPPLRLAGRVDPAPVRVGIADTPLFPHPQLSGRYVNYGPEFRPGGEPQPDAGHATFIAGVVLRRAPGAALVNRPVLSLGARANTWDVAADLMFFLDDENRVDVLTLAFGTYTRDGRPPLVLARAMERLTSHTVVLAAAGNHGMARSPARAALGQLTRRTVTYPAAIDGVCAVAAVTANGGLASFSPPWLPWMNLTAPGVDVESLYLEGPVRTHPDRQPPCFPGWARWSGSSFAVAAAAGEIARRTVPGRKTAREALDEILAGAAASDGIRPFEGLPTGPLLEERRAA